MQSGDRTDDGSMRQAMLNKLSAIYAEYHLSPIQQFAVDKFMRDLVADRNNDKVDRVREWIVKKINGVKIPPIVEGQKGCPGIVPGLRAKQWWYEVVMFRNSEDFPWIKVFEDNLEKIKQEVLGLKSKSGFQPYRAPTWTLENKAEDGVGTEGTDKGKWNIFYLYLHELKFEENCEKLPFTVSLIEKHIPRHYHHALISAMVPDTHILKHYGPTNKKLRFHLPLTGVQGSYLRVGDEKRPLQEGKVNKYHMQGYVFDDSFEHEAWHEGKTTRVILIADLWHPDLSDHEVKFFNMLQKVR